ncbi:hypothetical protein D918_07032 [Trichuris suis]|nr:hypothetical protein D918_07032 [Trichuris suis]
MDLASITLIASVFSVAPSFCYTLSKGRIGQPCRPEDNWWYSYSEDATKYMYCKANEWKYVLVTCEKINGIQKIFNETHQVCLFPDDVPLASLKADAKNRQIFVGHVCEANIDCADGMHCTDGHCTCLDHHIQFNSLCYEGKLIVETRSAGCWPGSKELL